MGYEAGKEYVAGRDSHWAEHGPPQRSSYISQAQYYEDLDEYNGYLSRESELNPEINQARQEPHRYSNVSNSDAVSAEGQGKLLKTMGRGYRRRMAQNEASP